jgi:lactate permease
MPLGLALDSMAAGAAFALWPVMWIVFNALALYNVTVASGRFDAFRSWIIEHLPNDRRVVLVVIGICFGCLLEGIAGFGTPIAITSALLIGLGFRALDALVFTLMFNTAPVAFGALGAPITNSRCSHTAARPCAGCHGWTPAAVHCHAAAVLCCSQSTAALVRCAASWPALLVAGGSFALAQFISSNFLGYALTDVLSSLTSLLIVIGFLKLWRVPVDPDFALQVQPAAPNNDIAAALRGRAGHRGSSSQPSSSAGSI